MDRKHFLVSQLWLRHLSVRTMEQLYSDLKFYTLLADAQCCFQVDKGLVFLAADQQGGDEDQQGGEEDAAAPSDATLLRLQVLMSLDERTDRKTTDDDKIVPGLYFILDGQSYIVNHTLISKISFHNQQATGSLEPPSACIGWPGVQMRWWLVAGIPPNIATQRLSYAVGTMNKMLLPVFAPHATISDADSATKSHMTADGDNRSLALAAPHADVNSYSRAGIKYNYFEGTGSAADTNGARSSSAGGGSNKRSRIDHGSDGTNIEGIGGAEGVEGSIGGSHHILCFSTWMDFMSSASDLLAVQVTESSVCDSFLQLKPNRDINRDINRDTHCKSSGALTSSNDPSDDMPAQAMASRRRSLDAAYSEGNIVECVKALPSPYNDTAVLFIAGVLTSDEAEAAEERLQAQRVAKENSMEGLLRELYSYSDRGGDGRGGAGFQGTDDQKALSNRRIILAAEALLLDMAVISDHVALLRGMPRADL